MHDLKFIRDNPEAFDDAMARRSLAPQSETILALDKARRDAQTKLQDIQSERNRKSKEIGIAKKSGDHIRMQEMVAAVANLKAELARFEKEETDAAVKLQSILETLPNRPFEDVPNGDDEDDNVELRVWGRRRDFSFTPAQHFDLGERLGLMDFENAAKISGARFVILKGGLARLERAIANFMLDTQTDLNGYHEVVPPALVRDHALYGTGQLPKFEEDLFHTDDDFWLIPTAEVPLTNLAREAILTEDQLPLRLTAWTPCFRSEAGAAGRDTRGMIRQHQFSKVEMVSIVHPDHSKSELERMTGCAEAILKKLDLPYRVVALCTGDLGFAARKTYDLEVWLPGQDRYREISSCSNCGDFQARRMKSRFKARGEKGTRFLHTLNGSGLAVGRTLVAILENYQNENGAITVPDVLRPYMGGLESIQPDS